LGPVSAGPSWFTDEAGGPFHVLQLWLKSCEFLNGFGVITVRVL
jgi:hypothetical protein